MVNIQLKHTLEVYAKVQIVFAILTHNRPESVLRLMDSIYKLELPVGASCEIVVFDNGSSDTNFRRLEVMCKKHETCPDLLRSETNHLMRGKCLVEDHVLNRWDGDVNDCIVHVDDDVCFSSGWLMSAWDAMQRNGWGASGSVEEWNGAVVYSGQRELSFSHEHVCGNQIQVWEWCWDQLLSDRDEVIVDFAGHRALLVRMSVADKVRHDPELLIGGEDIDFSLSIRSAGEKVGIAHNSLIEHRGLGEEDAPRFRTQEHVLKSWSQFYKKWGFVRGNAASEAGLSRQKWLEQVVQRSAGTGGEIGR